MTLKVLHVIARLNIGGTSTYINNLVKSSESLDIEHLIVTGKVQGSEIEDPRTSNLPHLRINTLGRKINPFQDLRAIWKLNQIVRQYQPDAINSHTFKAGLLVRLLPNKIAKLHTYHGHLLEDPEFSKLQKRIIVRIERALAKRAKILTVTGENVRRDLQQVRIRHEHWVCITPGIEDIQKTTEDESQSIPTADSDTLYDMVVGWHSRFAPVKNVPLVMEVASKNPNFLFLMSGGGPLFSRYQHDHPSNVKLLGWQSPEVIFRRSDVVLSTSHNEGLPFSLIEASLMGVPCIATGVGGTEQIVINEMTGYIVKPNADEISAKLQYLSKHDDVRDEYGKNARRYALEHFGFEVFADKYLTMVRDAINL